MDKAAAGTATERRRKRIESSVSQGSPPGDTTFVSTFIGAIEDLYRTDPGPRACWVSVRKARNPLPVRKLPGRAHSLRGPRAAVARPAAVVRLLHQPVVRGHAR